MTENTYAQLLLERLGMTEEQLNKPRIVAFIPSILQTLANRVANHTIDRPSVRELLRKDFSVTVTLGVGSMMTPLTAAEPLLEEFARGWLVYNTADTRYAYSYVADKNSLLLDRPKGLGYFTVDGSSLLVVSSAGSRTISATYTVHGNYTPTIDLLPVSLNDDALNVGVELLRMGAPQPPEPAAANE